MRRWIVVVATVFAFVAILLGAWALLGRPADEPSTLPPPDAPAADPRPPAAEETVRTNRRARRAAATPDEAEDCVVEGRVVGPDGVPVAGVAVFVDFTRPARTDADGRFRLTGLAIGEQVVRADVDGDVTKVPVTFTAATRTQTVDIRLAAAPGPALLVDVRFAVTPQTPPALEIAMTDVDDGEDADETWYALPSERRVLVRVSASALRTNRPARATVRCLGFRPTTAALPEDGPGTVTIHVPTGGLRPTGRVLDAAGRPAPDAAIYACRSIGDIDDPADSRSAADGSFTVPEDLESWIVALRRGRDVSQWVRLDDVEGEVVLTLAPGGTVEGTVRQEDTRAPAEGVPVELALRYENSGARWKTVTDASGAYRFDAVPLATRAKPRVPDQDRWRPADIDPDGPRFDVHASEQGPNPAVHVFRAPGETWRRDLTARLERGVETTFEFRLPPGAAAPEYVHVGITGTFASGSMTSTGGHAYDPAAPRLVRYLRVGAWEFRFSAPGLAAPPVVLEITGDGPARAVVVDLTAPKSRVLVRPVGPGGAPLGSAGLEIQGWVEHARTGRSLGGVTTGADGTADMTDELASAVGTDDAEIRLSVNGPDFFRHDGFGRFPDRTVRWSEIQAARRERPEQDFVIDVPVRAFVEIDVLVLRRGTKAPAAGVVLEARPATAFERARYVTDDRGAVTVRLRSERGGSLIALPPLQGRWTWVWFAPTDADFLDGRGVRAEGGRFVARISVEPTRVVRGVVVDDGGRALGDLAAGGQGWRTRPDGSFETTVPQSQTWFSASFDGWFVEDVPLPPGDADVKLVAYRMRSLRITVNGARDTTARIDASVKMHGVDSWESTADCVRQDAALVARIDAPARPLRVVVRTADRRLRAEADVAPAQDHVDLTLVAVPLRTVALRIADPRGTTLADREVILVYPRCELRARTDAAGVVRFEVPETLDDPLAVSVAGHGVKPHTLDADEIGAAPVAVSAAPNVEIAVQPAAATGGKRRATLVQVLAGGTRIDATSTGWSTSDGIETLSFTLGASEGSTLEAEIDGRTFTWTYDPAKQEEFVAKLGQ